MTPSPDWSIRTTGFFSLTRPPRRSMIFSLICPEPPTNFLSWNTQTTPQQSCACGACIMYHWHSKQTPFFRGCQNILGNFCSLTWKCMHFIFSFRELLKCFPHLTTISSLFKTKSNSNLIRKSLLQMRSPKRFYRPV